MNILPKKSWHVGTKKNIERVRRDEAEAERRERIEQDRQLQAEHEARKRELKSRAGIVEPEGAKHINLFEDANDKSTNDDHEIEERRRDDAWQERVGIMRKLVRDEDTNKPWYATGKPLSMMRRPQTTDEADANERRETRSSLITSIYDPMTAIKDAEAIVAAKRAARRQQQSVEPKQPPLCTKLVAVSSASGERQWKSERGASDSSPEIIEIIEAKGHKRKSEHEPDDPNHHKRHKKHKKHKKHRR